MSAIRLIVLMGVSGCGKTTVGNLLAGRMGWDFFDADAFHPPGNISKMSSGIPLDDEDREPWLLRLKTEVIDTALEGNPAVLACSALKASYRRIMGLQRNGIATVHLVCDLPTLASRLAARTDHFMKAEMLPSQVEALEIPSPAEALHIPAALEPAFIVDRILSEIRM